MPVDGFARNLAYKNSKKLSEIISAKDFGAKGDGTTDDTAAVQAFVTYLAGNARRGVVPAGTYKLTKTIHVPNRQGWSIVGHGWETTTFKMATDNVPIFNVGGAEYFNGTGAQTAFALNYTNPVAQVRVNGAAKVLGVDYTIAGNTLTFTAAPSAGTINVAVFYELSSQQGYGVEMSDFGLDYTNAQTGNTNAHCLLYSTMIFEGRLHRVTFKGGYCGIKVLANIGGPWGSNWDDLWFRAGLRGSAMDWTDAVNGVPNNVWGRILVECNNLTAPIFNQVKGYNWTIGAIELLTATNVQWFNFQAGSEVRMDAIKLEQVAYTVAGSSFTGSSLIYAPSCAIQLGHLFIGGVTQNMNPTDRLTVFGGAVRDLRVDYVDTSFTTSIANFSLTGVSGGRVSFGRIVDTGSGAYPVPLTNFGGTTAANFVTYDWDADLRLSDDIGNADYTTSHGGANIIIAQTALTASRTIEIMPSTTYLFNGKRYRIVSRGAVNGANTLVIKAGGTTKATISADNYAVELVWRRHPTAHTGWQIVSQGAA